MGCGLGPDWGRETIARLLHFPAYTATPRTNGAMAQRPLPSSCKAAPFPNRPMICSAAVALLAAHQAASHAHPLHPHPRPPATALLGASLYHHAPTRPLTPPQPARRAAPSPPPATPGLLGRPRACIWEHAYRGTHMGACYASAASHIRHQGRTFNPCPPATALLSASLYASCSHTLGEVMLCGGPARWRGPSSAYRSCRSGTSAACMRRLAVMRRYTGTHNYRSCHEFSSLSNGNSVRRGVACVRRPAVGAAAAAVVRWWVRPADTKGRAGPHSPCRQPRPIFQTYPDPSWGRGGSADRVVAPLIEGAAGASNHAGTASGAGAVGEGGVGWSQTHLCATHPRHQWVRPAAPTAVHPSLPWPLFRAPTPLQLNTGGRSRLLPIEPRLYNPIHSLVYITP